MIRPNPRRIAAGALSLALLGTLAGHATSALAAPSFPTPSAADLVASDFTLYFANAGAAVADTVARGDHLGLYQTRSDQPYGLETKTGASWGYVVDQTSNPTANSNSGNDKWASLRYDAEPAGASLPSRQVSYDFDVPNGTYDVTLGFDVPDSWGSRRVVARAEGNDLESFDTGVAQLQKTYPVTVTDGTLDVAVGSPANRTDVNADPLVNFILVKAQPNWSDLGLLEAKIDQTTLSADEAAGYASETVADLEDAQHEAQSLIDSGSTDPTANHAAFDAITTAYTALRTITTYDSFRPGGAWTDDQGRAIQAHGGQVVTAKDGDGKRIYYWYGEDRTNGYWDSPGVHVYSSYDLYNWTDRGLALRSMKTKDQFDTDPYFESLYAGYTTEQKDAVFRDLGTSQITAGVNPAVLERPKVIYNEHTHRWVMWIHTDGPSATSNAQYAKATAGVATSDSPFGPFRYVDSYRLDVAPAGEPNYQPDNPGMARDMNLFVDDDGTAYIIYSSEENYSLFISKLNADYTQLVTPAATAVKGVDFTRPYVGAHREAPALFKYDGTYYLITSGATGWDPNPASWATATDILGTWTDHGNPVVGDQASTTCQSQSTSVLPVNAAKGRFIFMADRWTPSDLANAPYVWLPIDFGEGGSISITCADDWDLDRLAPYQKWSVDVDLPDHVWLNDTGSLPDEVNVVTSSGTTREPVTWAASGISRPGASTLQGTLTDGRTFTRNTVVVPHGLKYVADAGGFETSDYTTIHKAAATEGALLNSVPDQPLGSDPGTGQTWGLSGDNGTFGDASGDIYTTGRYAKNSSPLTYTFTGLAPGKYQVYAGYYDPWPWANRAGKVTINGEVKENTQLFTSDHVNVTYPDVVVGEDGKLVYTITPTRSPDIQISYVMVARPKAKQSLSFDPLADKNADDAAFGLSATASSGLPVSYAADGVCTVHDAEVTLTGAGECTITASQAGNDDFLPAKDVSQTFTVRPAVLDDFNRANGAIGSKWTGATSDAFYRIEANRLRVRIGGPLLYKTPFGATQEASFTFTSVDSKLPSQGLMLKTQSSTSADAGAIWAVYDPTRKAVRVSTLRLGTTAWKTYPETKVTFAAGDVFTARADADGKVIISKNEKTISTTELSSADAAFFDGKGGRIGIWSVLATGTTLDDFQGGTIQR